MLTGRLEYSGDGALRLSVPMSLVTGAFSALAPLGVSLPRRDGKFLPGVLVMTAAEVEKIDAKNIVERGRSFSYQLGNLRDREASSSDSEYSRYWEFVVSSGDLGKLRRSYGLETTPAGGFVIGVGARKRSVLRASPVTRLTA